MKNFYRISDSKFLGTYENMYKMANEWPKEFDDDDFRSEAEVEVKNPRIKVYKVLLASGERNDVKGSISRVDAVFLEYISKETDKSINWGSDNRAHKFGIDFEKVDTAPDGALQVSTYGNIGELSISK